MSWLSKSDQITFSGKPKKIREGEALKKFKETLPNLPEEVLESWKQCFRQRSPLVRPTFFEQQTHCLILKELKKRNEELKN